MGKNIKLFNTKSEYDSYKESDNFTTPNVSVCKSDLEIVYYNRYIREPYDGFVKLTLDDGDEVEIQGSGQLKSTHVNAYSASCISAEIGKECTSIGGYIFYNFTNITGVTIGCTGGYHDAFNGQSTIKKVTLCNNITVIDTNAFSGCTSLTSITIPDSVTTIGDSAFSDCTSLKNIDIPDSVRSNGLGTMVFSDCTSLTSVTIGNGITTIPQGVFSGCISLRSVKMSDEMTLIGVSAFQDCTSLTSIVIPSGVTQISSYAFYDCPILSSITIKAATPPTTSIYMFSPNVSGRKFYVPSNSVNTYKTTSGWSNYANEIYPIQ